jgi:hypothetical protein
MSVFLWPGRLPPIGPPSNIAGTTHSARAICLPPSTALQWRMPELSRRRSTDAREECWHIYYGDIHAGTIAIRTGNLMMRIRGSGIAVSIRDRSRASNRTARPPPSTRPAPISSAPGGCFCRIELRLISRRGAISGLDREEIRAVGCRQAAAAERMGAREAMQHLFEMPVRQYLQQSPPRGKLGPRPSHHAGARASLRVKHQRVGNDRSMIRYRCPAVASSSRLRMPPLTS